MIRYVRSGLVAAFVLLGAGPASAERLSLMPSGHVVAPVSVNGSGPADFIVDTAASHSVVYPPLRTRLGVASAPAPHDAEMQAASGAMQIEMLSLDRVELAGRSRSPFVAVSMPLAPHMPQDLAGIIGADMLGDYVAEFDVPAGRLLLHDASARLDAAGGWTAISVRLNDERFAILQGTLDGRPIQVLLDTGARRTVINWAAARLLGLAPGDPSLSATEPLGGASAHRTAAVRRDFGALAVGDVSLSAADITIADLSVFTPLGWQDQPAMILGMDRLRMLRFAVDYPRSRLLVHRP